MGMKKTQLIIILMFVILILFFSGCTNNEPNGTPDGNITDNNGSNGTPDEYIAARPDPEFDNFTWTLPTGASSLRLSLPADIDDFIVDGGMNIGGYGLHAGGHVEGLGHTWISLKKGTPVKSWADGVVLDVWIDDPPDGEYKIEIDYGHNLIGGHAEILTPLVEIGDYVTRGQEIALGMGSGYSSAEFSLTDAGRNDSIMQLNASGPGYRGSHASPFDYLEDDDKRALVEAYKEYVIDPYVQDETIVGYFEPYQPYLTNDPLLHRSNPGKLTGSWLLISSNWSCEPPNDFLFFIEADNPYFTGNIVKSQEDSCWDAEWELNGEFEVDYDTNHILVKKNRDGDKTFGLFEINESGERAILTIEFQNDAYPSSFTNNALTYIQRDSIGVRIDGMNLGVWSLD
jgi:hypothetical protein